MKVSPCLSSQLPASTNCALSMQHSANYPMPAAAVVRPSSHRFDAVELTTSDPPAVKPKRRRSVGSKSTGTPQTGSSRRAKSRPAVRQMTPPDRVSPTAATDWKHGKSTKIPYAEQRASVCSSRRYGGGYPDVYNNPAMHYLTVLQPILPGETGPAAEKLKQMAANYQRLKTESDDIENNVNQQGGGRWSSCSRLDATSYRAAVGQRYYGYPTTYNSPVAYYGIGAVKTQAGSDIDCETPNTYRTTSVNCCSLNETPVSGLTSSDRPPAVQCYDSLPDQVSGQHYNASPATYCGYQDGRPAVYGGKQQHGYDGRDTAQHGYPLPDAYSCQPSTWSSLGMGDVERCQRYDAGTSAVQQTPACGGSKYVPSLAASNAFTNSSNIQYQLSQGNHWQNTSASSCAVSSSPSAATMIDGNGGCQFMLPSPSEAGAWIQQNIDVLGCHANDSTDGECAVVPDDIKVCDAAADTELFDIDPTRSGIELY